VRNFLDGLKIVVLHGNCTTDVNYCATQSKWGGIMGHICLESRTNETNGLQLLQIFHFNCTELKGLYDVSRRIDVAHNISS
jgi:hypothetical protein